MIPAEDETPGGEPGRGREGAPTPFGRSEGDPLAERRARRAGDTGEGALARRAEAAEATVETLERHVASLQQRLHDAEEECSRLAELLEVERASAIAGEDELRRVKQREYAEQQLRVEAEERLDEFDRGARADGELIERRLQASERESRDLVDKLEALRRRLAEADHAAVAERGALVRAEGELRGRVEALEERAVEMQRALDAERAWRQETERSLEILRNGHGRMEALLGEIRALVRRLAAALAGRSEPVTTPASEPVAVPASEPVAAPAGEPAAIPPGEPVAVPPGEPVAAPLGEPAAGPSAAEMAEALAAAVERLRARAEAAPLDGEEAAREAALRASHKHSMSGIGRWRKRRKQRAGAPDGRRSAA